ncbi:MAG: DsrE family protein [Gallionellaceae bacterium]|jgi:uncharacterized protein involved in oxidation of intracellular sulfur
MNHLYILNDGPYGSERSYNALRLAGAVSKMEDNAVRIFLIGDAASAAHRNQKVPAGFYNVETMLGNVIRHGGEVGICGTCMDARGMSENDIADGAQRSTLAALAEWTVWADKVLVF